MLLRPLGRNISTLKSNYTTKALKYLKRDLIKTSPVNNYTKKRVIIFIPWIFNVSIIRKSENLNYNFYIYNTLFYIFFWLPTSFSNVFFEKETNSIHAVSIARTSYLHVYLTHLAFVYNSFAKLFFRKVKFKGKGYYIYKNLRNTIAPQFGYSHRVYIYSIQNSVKFTSKTSLIIFGFLPCSIINTSQQLKSYRSINIFTGRGVRFARQVIYSKPGKVSSYR